MNNNISWYDAQQNFSRGVAVSPETCLQTASPSPSTHPNLGRIYTRKLVPSILCVSEGGASLNLQLPQQIHRHWFVLPAVPVAPTLSCTGHQYSARLDGEDEVIALRPLLKGRTETSKAIHPPYCYLVFLH